MTSLLARIGSWILGSDTPFNPSLSEIIEVRMLLCRFVPVELADIILHEATYYHVRVACVSTPCDISDRHTHRADTPILSINLTSTEDARLLECVLRVQAVVKGHDQGWSGYPEDRGTDRNAWTWYSIGSADPATHEQRLATNLHAVPRTQTHGPFVWDRDSELVALLKRDRVLEVWAHARYPGWVNHVDYAELSVTFFPS